MWIAAATRGVTPIRGSGAGGCQAAVAVLGIAALACDRRRTAPSPPGSYWMRLGCSPVRPSAVRHRRRQPSRGRSGPWSRKLRTNGARARSSTAGHWRRRRHAVAATSERPRPGEDEHVVAGPRGSPPGSGRYHSTTSPFFWAWSTWPSAGGRLPGANVAAALAAVGVGRPVEVAPPGLELGDGPPPGPAVGDDHPRHRDGGEGDRGGHCGAQMGRRRRRLACSAAGMRCALVGRGYPVPGLPGPSRTSVERAASSCPREGSGPGPVEYAQPPSAVGGHGHRGQEVELAVAAGQDR